VSGISDKPDNAWLVEAINRAKQSELPLLVQSFVDGDEDPVEAAASMIDAIELSLLSLTGDITEEKLRNALRSVSEPYAESIGAQWERVADAILVTVERPPPDPKNHIFNSWGR
jgi:hypothetical protein